MKPSETKRITNQCMKFLEWQDEEKKKYLTWNISLKHLIKKEDRF